MVEELSLWALLASGEVAHELSEMATVGGVGEYVDVLRTLYQTLDLGFSYYPMAHFRGAFDPRVDTNPDGPLWEPVLDVSLTLHNYSINQKTDRASGGFSLRNTSY